jgi:outer membrane protein assembly factor BamB
MSGAVAVANAVVYVHASREGVLYALDAARGDVLAQSDLGIAISGPSISNGQVYLVLGDVTGTSGSQPGGAVVALGLGDGTSE